MLLSFLQGCYNEMSNIMNPYSSTFIAIGVVLVIIEVRKSFILSIRLKKMLKIISKVH